MATEIPVGTERIAAAFTAHGRRSALMPYLMGGYPDVAGSLAIANAYVDAGADLIELGVPFSDPLADGPVIQAAGERALSSGTTLDDIFAIAEQLSPRVPIVTMCYANMIHARGPDAFAERLAEAGGSGVIVPDQPVDEADAIIAACEANSLAFVPLVAPTTTDERLELIARRAQGFIYVVSVAGVTGERGELPRELPQVVQRVRSHTDLPIAVGFGVSTPAQAREVGEIADGVIIGSRLVRMVGDAASVEEATGAIGAFLRETASALDYEARG